jgi:hypothetical protein
MSGYVLAPGETSIPRIVQMVRQLLEGRSNATGSITLTPNATSTLVPALNCGTDSAIFLFPQTANAAAAMATTFVGPSDVSRGQFMIHHASSPNTDLSFWWSSFG